MTGKFKSAFAALAILVFAVQCTPTEESEYRARAISLASEGEDEMAQPADENDGYLTNPTTQTASIQNPSIPAPEKAPLPTTDPSCAEPGQAMGGLGVMGEAAQADGDALDEPQEADVVTWPVYADDARHFTISYPPHFIVEHLDDTALAQLTPVPMAAVHFRDQEMAQSDVAELAPPEFSIRVFPNEMRQSIEEWLAETGLLKADQFTERYQGAHESGVIVYSRHFIAPGRFVYVASDAYVFQLVPLGRQAELMLDTFEITS